MWKTFGPFTLSTAPWREWRFPRVGVYLDNHLREYWMLYIYLGRALLRIKLHRKG